MYTADDRQRDIALKSPGPTQPAVGGAQVSASRAAAPPSAIPPDSNAPSASSIGDTRRLTGDFDATPVSRPAAASARGFNPGAVNVTRQPNGVLEFSGMNVGSGPVQYEGAAGFKPRGGTLNTMSSEGFKQVAPSLQAQAAEARMQVNGNASYFNGPRGDLGGNQNATVMSGETYGVLGRQSQADSLLSDAMTKRPGESRADFATRSGAAQRALGFQVDERNNVRSNETSRRGQDLNFDATTQGQGLGFTSNALDRASREQTEAARLGLDAGRLQLETFKALNEKRDAPSGFRWTEGGNLQAIPGGPGDKSQTLRPMPSSAAGGLLENRRNARRADDALALLNGETLPGGTQGDPNATGLKGYLPNQLLNRLDPKGVDTRAAIADLGSLVIHDRSGAAVTAAEFPRLAPFIPTEKDDPETARKKLSAFSKNYRALAGDTEEFYRASGYNVPAAEAAQQPAATPVSQAGPAAAPQTGQVVRGYRFLGGDPSDRNNWEAGQ